MRLVSGKIDAGSPAFHVLQDTRLLLRWVYGMRFAVAISVMAVALFVWGDSPSGNQIGLAATLAFAFVSVFSVVSALYSELRNSSPPNWFLFLQVAIDLLLVTLIVDATGAGESPLAALYVVVITLGFLMLPPTTAGIATVLGSALYATDVYLRAGTPIALVPAGLVVLVLALTGVVVREVVLQLKSAGAGSAELAAQLQSVKLQAADILRNIRSGIITVDATGRLLQANPAAATLLGIELDAFLEKPVLSRIHIASPELAEMLIRTIKRPIRINRGEALMPVNGGNVPLGVTTTFAVNASGVPTSATAIFQDISESKKTELLGLRAERLAAVAELSASLAHEIKNPLASIRSSVEQLARVEYLDDDHRTLASLVERESDRLSRLLSEFLEFARVQATHFRTVDIVQVAKGACDLAAEHPDVGSDLSVDFTSEAAQLVIDGDEDLLHRAIFNLVLNGAQASPPGGTVRVSVRARSNVLLRAGGAGAVNVAEVTVEDSGPGISDEIRPRIFDPFYTTKSDGTGLGLSVVHRAITSHNGDVLVDSGGGGTRFTILLPVEQTSREGRT